MSELGSYGSIFNLGHRAVQHLLDGPVIVEEKVDGSQFSFGVLADGSLSMRSKGAIVYKESPGMFKAAAETVVGLYEAKKLEVGLVYRGEFFAKPKHNALAYDRIPDGHIAIFDIEATEDHADTFRGFFGPIAKEFEAKRLGLEVVPMLHSGLVQSRDQVQSFLDTISFLGGQKIEGVVIKPYNYDVYGQDKHVLMGKYVSEHFKEVHDKSWRADNPTRTDVVQRLIASLKTPARWTKAVLHLRERGLIQDSPSDIGLLIKEVQADLDKEEQDYAKAQLFAHFWPQIKRGAHAGVAEWYKEKLLQEQFARIGENQGVEGSQEGAVVLSGHDHAATDDTVPEVL